MDFDLDAYLARLGIGAVPVSPEGLAALQKAQLQAIPFEDFDSYLGVLPDLGPEALFEKLVTRRRGGYCFELNALFGAALTALGFEPRRIMARVRRDNSGGVRSHLALRVETGGRSFLADTGFGGPCALLPLDLGERGEQALPNGTYHLREEAETGELVLERKGSSGWTALYGLDDGRVTDLDIAAANYLCTHWAHMPFPSHLMLAGFDGDTRIGVFDRAVTRLNAIGEDRHVLESFAELEALVVRELKIGVAPEVIEQAWAKLTASA